MYDFGSLNLSPSDEMEIAAQLGQPWAQDPQIYKWLLMTPMGEVMFQFREKGGVFVFPGGNLAVKDARNPF